MEGVLYILAEKFLNKMDLDELKEEIKVTRLGQMLYDDGWDAGMVQGMSRGISDMILDFLEDLGSVPQKLTDAIQGTTDEATLRLWGKIAGKAESLEEFCEKTGIEL